MAAASTVTVACKLPNGLAATVGETTVAFAGANDPKALLGFGLTPNVDADFWTAWTTAVGKDFAPIKSMALFALDTTAKASAAVKEMSADIKTGLERLDPDKPGPGIKKDEAAHKE